MEECWVFEVWSFNDSVNRASFLAEATEDALGHVNVIFSCSSRSIWSWLRFDDNSESWASSFAKFASNAPLFTSWVSSERMLTSEHRGQSSFLPRVMDNVIRLEARPSSQEQRWPSQLSHNKWFVHSLCNICSVNIVRKLISYGQPHILLVIVILRIKVVRVVVLWISLRNVQKP